MKIRILVILIIIISSASAKSEIPRKFDIKKDSLVSGPVICVSVPHYFRVANKPHPMPNNICAIAVL